MPETVFAVRAAVLQRTIDILKRLPWEDVSPIMPELLQSQAVPVPEAPAAAPAPEPTE